MPASTGGYASDNESIPAPPSVPEQQIDFNQTKKMRKQPRVEIVESDEADDGGANHPLYKKREELLTEMANIEAAPEEARENGDQANYEKLANMLSAAARELQLINHDIERLESET